LSNLPTVAKGKGKEEKERSGTELPKEVFLTKERKKKGKKGSKKRRGGPLLPSLI